VILGGFGPRLGAGVGISIATAVGGALAGMRLTGGLAGVSLLGIAPGAVIGLALPIELAATLRELHREETSIAAGGEAMRRALSDWLRHAVPAVVLAAAMPVALFATPLPQSGSIVLGCALAAVLSLAATAATAPALIALNPPHVPPADEAVAERRLARALGRLRAIPGSLARSPRLSLAAGAVALAAGLALAVPALDAQTRGLGAADLPAGSPARTAAQLTGGSAGAGAGAQSSAARPKAGDALSRDLPLAAGIAAAVLALAVLALGHSLRLVPVVALALIPAAAAFGLLVWVFQRGHLAGAIGQRGQGALDTGAVASVVAALAAVSAARLALALAAVRAKRRLGIAAEGASQLAARVTLPGALASTHVVAGACGVLAGADLYPAREFGLAVAIGVLIDLVVVRVPQLAVLGRWSR
jgi:hypothetical protein